MAEMVILNKHVVVPVIKFVPLNWLLIAGIIKISL